MAKKKSEDSWWLAAAGVGLGALIWWLFRKTPALPDRMTTDKPVAPVEPPENLPTVGAVASRFDEVRELYKMGYLSPERTITQVHDLETVVAELLLRRVGEQASAEALVARMESFLFEVRTHQALMQTPPEA